LFCYRKNVDIFCFPRYHYYRPANDPHSLSNQAAVTRHQWWHISLKKTDKQSHSHSHSFAAPYSTTIKTTTKKKQGEIRVEKDRKEIDGQTDYLKFVDFNLKKKTKLDESVRKKEWTEESNQSYKNRIHVKKIQNVSQLIDPILRSVSKHCERDREMTTPLEITNKKFSRLEMVGLSDINSTPRSRRLAMAKLVGRNSVGSGGDHKCGSRPSRSPLHLYSVIRHSLVHIISSADHLIS